MFNATKIRIYPTTEQVSGLAKQFGCARWIANWALAKWQDTYRRTGKGLNYHTLAVSLPKLKQEHEWLKGADAQALQQSVQHVARAFENFFKCRTKYPRFKAKHGKQSFSYPQRVKIVERRETEWGLIYLPKIGHLRAKIHRPITGDIKTVTVSLDEAGRYWASILTDDGCPAPIPSREGSAIGIDLGLTHFAITSTGQKIANPRFVSRAQRNLKRKQQSLSRKKKGSANRNKARLKVARAHEKVRRARADFLHKTSCRLVNENQVICLESLNVRGMMKNRSLAKAIGDVGWSTFVNFLAYKAERAGKIVVQTHRFYPSSKACNECGQIVDSLPLNVRSWTCIGCGAVHDRDVNAAKNIRDEGLRITAEGYSVAA